MAQHIIETLKARGYIQQITHEPELNTLLEDQRVTFYIGFDPTADSLHIGHFIPLMAMAHMQQAGHRPIALVGGGTAMVGDPSGRTDMRRMLTSEDIDQNVQCIKLQIARFLDFSEGQALLINNADWLMKLNYVEFLREIGVHFSVNRMLTAECFKQRMEKGLSFLEFNYMLMQAYDFLMLYQQHGCALQMGGDDQWSNILAGADLVRRKEQGEAYALTLSLLTNSQGQKMGKTASGALWLDAKRTSPYEFYQYWRNIDDADVDNCLKMLTFLPLERIAELTAHRDERMNQAKRTLAYEVTQLIHGESEADQAQQAADALFTGGGDVEAVAHTVFTRAQAMQEYTIVDLLALTGLAASKSDARRLVQSGAVTAGEQKITDITAKLEEAWLNDNAILLKKGKKGFHRILVEG